MLLALEDGAAIPAPPAGEIQPASDAPRLQWLTGNRLVVAVDRTLGPLGVWGADGPTLIPLAGRLTLEDPSREEGTPAGEGASSLRLAPGRWERRFRLEDGTLLVERGLVLEEEAVLLLEWENGEPDSPGGVGTEIRIRPRFLPPPEVGDLGLDAGPRILRPGGRLRVALVHEAAGGAAVDRLVARPGDRARVRERRGRSYPGEGFALEYQEGKSGSQGESGPGSLSHPLQMLDDASLGPAGPAILRGFPPSPPPRILEGAGLVEYGLACLFTGRWERAQAILAEGGSGPEGGVGREGAVGPEDAASRGGGSLAHLLLAARWCLWTGRQLPMARHGMEQMVSRALEEGRAEREGRPPAAGAAFPPLPAVLEELANGLEGVGGGDPGRLRREAASLRERPGSAGFRSIRLPVLGSPAPEGTPPPPPSTASLPPPEAFASVHEPAIRPHRTLHAARLVRSWVEGRLGVEPDAAVGRLSLALDLRGWSPPFTWLRLEGLRVGDARVSLACRAVEGALTFRVAQSAGRVPLNLIFQAHLPLARVQRVRLGAESVQVEVRKEEEGHLVRCQFPLDSERNLTVEG